MEKLLYKHLEEKNYIRIQVCKSRRDEIIYSKSLRTELKPQINIQADTGRLKNTHVWKILS